MGAAKVLEHVLSGSSDATIRFQELCSLLESLGFEKRIRAAITSSAEKEWKKRSTCSAKETKRSPTR